MKFPDNPAGQAWDRATLTNGIEPAALPLGLYMQAAVAERADRSQAGRWQPNLDAVLFPDVPVPTAPPAGMGIGPRRLER